MIGGGIVGLACAFNLQRAGFETTLFDDPGATPPASWGNAGHLAIEQVMPLASWPNLMSMPRRLFRFGGPLDFRLADIAAWAPWAFRYVKAFSSSGHGRTALSALLGDAMPAWHRLARSVGRPDLVIEAGHHIVWESNAAGAAAVLSGDHGTARVRRMDETKLSELGRHVRVPLAGGVTFENTGQISDPGAALDILCDAFSAAGGIVRRERVRTVTEARITVVAAGIGSGALLRSLGHVVPIIAERGYHIEGDAGDWGGLPPIVFEDRSMIVTQFGKRLRAASFVEFGRAESSPDPRKWARLRQHVADLGIPMTEPIREWSGVRPTLPDYLPAIGVSRRAPGLYYAFGHQHLGLTLAAITGELVAALVQGHALPIDMTPFDLTRFGL